MTRATIYRYVFNNLANFTDPTGEIFWVPLLIGGFFIITKAADYTFTAYDIYESQRVLRDACAHDTARLLASLNIALAVVLELLRPGEALPVGLPADDLARRGVIKAAQRPCKGRNRIETQS